MRLDEAWDEAISDVSHLDINPKRKKAWLNRRVFEIYTRYNR